MTELEKALRELQELERAGLRLPWSPEFIVSQEQAGHVVDLETGAIVINGAEQRHVGPAKGAQ